MRHPARTDAPAGRRPARHPRARRAGGLPGLAVILIVGLGLSLAACGGDDGAGVRNVDGGSGSGSGSGTGSGSSPGTTSTTSASGLGGQGPSGTTSDAAVLKAVQDYRLWVTAETHSLVTDTRTFTDAVRAGDIAKAKAAFAPSRVHWERIEPIAGLVKEIDGTVDARVDDFEGVDDPAFTGWHRLEHLLWQRNTTEGGKPFADQLDADIATLNQRIRTIEFPPAVVALGPAELIQEVSQGKITGEEDRYARTDLWDFDANVDGSRKLVELLTPALQAKDAALLGEVQAGFAQIDRGLAEYAVPGGGFKPYTALAKDDKDRMQAELANLSEHLARIPGVLGLR